MNERIRAREVRVIDDVETLSAKIELQRLADLPPPLDAHPVLDHGRTVERKSAPASRDTFRTRFEW